MYVVHTRFTEEALNKKGETEIIKTNGVTFAAIEVGGKLHWGASICNPIDMYCKKTGRVKATGRAKSKKFHFETEMMSISTANLFAKLMKIVIINDKKDIPSHEKIDKMLKTAKSQEKLNQTLKPPKEVKKSC